MRWASNLLTYGLMGVGVAALALSSHQGKLVNAQQQLPPEPEPIVTLETPAQPKRHKITVTLTSPENLKVTEGERIKEGDVISDRTQARQQLEARKQKLELAIKQLSLPLHQLSPLPEPNFAQEELAIAQAKMELDLATQALESSTELPFKEEWMNEAMRPEKVKERASLKERQIKAAIALESSLARLSEAKTRYQQQQYQHAIQLAAHQTNLQKQQYDLVSLSNQLQEVEQELGELVQVRSPYGGRVRRVKILGQNERLITAEVTLDIRDRR